MRNPLRLLFLIPLLLTAGALPVTGVAQPRPALAAVCPATAAAPPTITAVDPGTINGEIGATIAVSGADFEENAIVVLSDFGALTTTCVNDGLLTAVVPAGIPGTPGGRTYRVKVITSQGETDTVNLVVKVPAGPTETPEPTGTLDPTGTPEPTGTPLPTDFVRPILTVASYGASAPELLPGQPIDFEMTLENTGQLAATNVIVTFKAGDLIPRATGGVRSIGTIAPGQPSRFFQPFTVSRDLSSRVATLAVEASYTDLYGNAYTANYELTFAARPRSGEAQPTATPTPGPSLRPQLVIDRYETDAEQLEPGGTFTLTLHVQNLGAADAQGVTMIVGGGSADDGGGGEGTPSPGGVSGGSGEFSKFAPIGASNVQFLGDVPAGAAVSPTQTLVVNVSTEPGAYPFKVSFTYTNEQERRFTDDQVITLLVYAPPQLDVSFYRDPNPIFAQQPAPLPIQINNLGRGSTVLGNMVISAEGSELTNNTVLVGRLDSGGFFTTDAILIAGQAGPLDVLVTIHYNDDFNKPQTITHTLAIEVVESPEFEPGMGPDGGPLEPPPAERETIFQVIWRFIRGLLGLDSARPTPGGPPDVMPPGEGEPMPGGGSGPGFAPKGP